MKYYLTIIRKTIAYAILSLFLMAAQTGYSQQIVVTGDWVRTINASDYASVTWDSPYFSVTSAANQISIDIYKYTGGLSWLWELLDNYGWIVTVGYSDESNWHSEFELNAIRTGDGASPYGGTITGGTAGVIIPRGGGAINFFSGTKMKNQIPVQYRLDNISALVPAGTYDATIIYTVIAI